MRPRWYRFPPRPSSGWILGLRGLQLAALIVGGGLALALLRSGGVLGVALFAGAMALVGTLGWLRLGAHTSLEWLPVSARFALASMSGTDSFRMSATTGHVVELARGASLQPREVRGPASLPAELADIELLETTLPRYGRAALGVAHDTRRGTYTAVLRCQPRAFVLLGETQQQVLLDAYGQLLVSFGQEGSPVRRIGWYERSLPAAGEELVAYLHSHRREELRDPKRAREDRGLRAMWELLEAQQHAAQDHEVLMALQLAPSHRDVAHYDSERDGALALCAEYTSHLVSELTRIGVASQEPLGPRNTAVPSARGLAGILRNGADPFGRDSRERTDGEVDPALFGPRARDVHAGHVQCDGALHATGHLAEWPRQDVRAMFLQRLIEAPITRTVSMVMDVLGPRKGVRRAESAAQEAQAEGWLRHKIGRRTTARERSREEAVHGTEHELAGGHALVRFAGFVTVSVPVEEGVAELNAAFRQMEAAALAAGLSLERMWMEQQDAWTYGLPLCRGLA